jgi:two-component system response regulator LytT
MNVLLLDDEYLALNLLEGYLQQLIEQGRSITLVGKAKHPLKALEILGEQEVDIIFLDIQMPNLSGVNLLRSLPKKPVAVFTTAYDEYAIEAFDLDVVDYLVKPIAFERFLQAFNKAATAVQARIKAFPPSDAHTLSQSHTKSPFLSIVADGKLVKIAHTDILFCEGAKEYVIVHTTQGNVMTLERMKRMEEMLPSPDFVRVHKSYIVSSSKVKSLDGAMLNVAGQMIPVSRELREDVVARIFG